MSYILCRTKPAAAPFYIENISTNIYSIEELCFYLYNNLYLVDETILNEKLCEWLQIELGLTALSKKVRGLLEQKVSVGQVLAPIFKEIYYLSHEEMRIFNAKLEQYEAQPARVRMKMKADYLYGNEKFRNALNIYKASLKLSEEDETGSQFKGSVYYNMGCAYAKLFQMDEAIHCFSLAYEHLRTMASIKSYLYAVYMEYGEEALEDKARQLGVDDERRDDILLEVEIAADELFETADGKEYARALEEKKKGNFDVYREAMKSLLTRLTGEYHKSTGY